MFDIFSNNAIVQGLIITVLGGIIVSIITAIITKAINRKPSNNIVSISSNDQAIYLNKPNDTLKGECIGRNELLNQIYKVIKNENPISFIGNHVSIVGWEGIGKTHFCQTLFNDLKYSKIYIGWIECNGSQSIYEIISKTFLNFKGKKKEHILTTIENLDRPCVLFIDQIDHHTPLDEIKELKECHNTTIVVSGLLKNIYFIDDEKHFSLDPLNDKIIRIIFKEKLIGENFETMSFADKSTVKLIISEYVKGNPFLAIAFTRAKAQNDNTWSNVWKNMNDRPSYGEENNYITNILKQLYKIPKLLENDKKTLSKLCVFSSLKYTEEVFNWSSIPMDCIDRLSKTHWLTQDDNLFYSMDRVRQDVLKKVLLYSENLKELIISFTNYIYNWKAHEDRGFNWISFYVEDILRKVKGNVPELMKDSDLFSRFAYIIASKYHFAIEENEKCIEWLNYCDPTGLKLPEDIMFSVYKDIQDKNGSNSDQYDMLFLNNNISKTTSTFSETKQYLLENEDIKAVLSNLQKNMIYSKAVLEFQVKIGMLFSPFKPSEIEEAYSRALESAKWFNDFEEKQKYLCGEYCLFFEIMEQYDKVKLLCKEHFDTYGFTLDNDHSCTMFYRYLCASMNSNDDEIINLLTTDEMIATLWQNQNLCITVAWSFGKFYLIYKKKGNDELAELYKRRMIILINRIKRFWHPDIKNYIEMSDYDFISYMHSHKELQESLEEALEREDAEALYLEGRYQEKQENFDRAFSLYERASAKDSLKGICSLALMYYRGQVESENFDKAREYWDYCCEREHRGSFYWLGIMLLNENYIDNNKELGTQYLTKAAEMGSKGAKQKLQEISNNLLPVNKSIGSQP